jgi:uncharacterized protein YidB (DUF937 family)
VPDVLDGTATSDLTTTAAATVGRASRRIGATFLKGTAMGLLDVLSGMLGKKKQTSKASGMPDLGGLGGLGNLGSLLGGKGGMGGGVLMALLPLLAGGGLGKILGGLQGSHASKLSSWVGTGPNDEIEPDELEAVLGSDQVAQIARDSGVSHEEAKGSLSKLLPGVIDHLSPNGSMPDSGGIESALGKLKGMLG